jgi:hypothetical protein
MLHIVGFPPLRIASRAYRALVLEREYHRMSKDICVDFLVRLVQDWIQHLSEGPTLTAEHKISWNYAKLNIMHTGDYIDYSISYGKIFRHLSSFFPKEDCFRIKRFDHEHC